MSDSRKYYYLKLKENYFDDDSIVLLESMQDGILYSYILLKPNGTDSTKTAYIKNMGWHFARYGGVAYADNPIYCIEPYRSFGASTSGNSVDRDVTLNGSGSTPGSNVWHALPAARREAIGMILLYSNQMWDYSISVTNTPKANNPNVPLRVATQMLIYEIVYGLRDPITFQKGNYFVHCEFRENGEIRLLIAFLPVRYEK